jgi:hypothetical protein
MPIVMGEPVGLATGADAEAAAGAEEVAGAEALTEAAAGALAEEAAVAVALAAVEEEPADGDFDFDELQPATSRATADRAAIDATGRGRPNRDACNRLCDTIESLHEGCVGVSGSGTWLDRRLQGGCIGGLCNRLCNRLP